jgi:acetamidase/formamidase
LHLLNSEVPAGLSRSIVLVALVCSTHVLARSAPQTSTTNGEPARPTQQDEYTEYALLAPETASFKILYEVTATTPGATTYFNPIRKGSQASEESVYDMMTGQPLAFEQVTGAEARASGLPGAAVDTDYIRVHLARPIPPDGGQARIRIVKTYKDPKTYFTEGEGIVFKRGLGIRRNAVVLPQGYWLSDCNVPSQVLSEPDGRIRISFMHQAPGEAALLLKARPGAPSGDAARPRPLTNARSWERPAEEGPTERTRLAERAAQDRDIVYFLQQPESHAFSLYHDYTESREGVDRYLNVVRAGSRVSNPSAKMLDTGDVLRTEIVTGRQLKSERRPQMNDRAGGGAGSEAEAVADDAQVVVVRFPPVMKGRSVRLRIAETYAAPESYRLEGDELVFDRSFGRPRNSVVLPSGWYLTALSIPGVVRQTIEGLTRVDFVNGRPDSIDVLLKAKRIARPSRSTSLPANEVQGTGPTTSGAQDRGVQATSSSTVRTLEPTPSTVAYGYYSAAAVPALRVRSGEALRIHTLLTSTPQRLEGAGVASDLVEPALREIVEKVKDKGPGGHILTGPIFVEGAEPGDVLEVRVEAIELAIPYAYNAFSTTRGFLPHDFQQGKMSIIPLDAVRMVAHFADGIEIPLRPFFGSMGVAPPAAAGRISSGPPGKHAGNLDNKDLVVGSTVYIPVNAPGALFEVGDGHAGQGDGEVDITALETSLVGTFRFVVRKDMHLTWPRAETPTDWITMGIDDDLTEAARIATREMIDFLATTKKLSREDAYMLTSVAGNLAITQVVDGPMGVHVRMPKAIFKPGVASR